MYFKDEIHNSILCTLFLCANINAIEYFQLNFTIVFHFRRIQHEKITCSARNRIF